MAWPTGSKVAGRDQLPDPLPSLEPLSRDCYRARIHFDGRQSEIIAVNLPHLTKDFLKYLRSRLENSSHPLNSVQD
jgi:hypothetical protein